MKNKLFITILILISFGVFGQRNPQYDNVDVKNKLYVGGTIQYKDAIFPSPDTMLTKNSTFENLTGNTISVDTFTVTGGILIDSLDGSYPGIQISQKDSILQTIDSTGTDYTVSTKYVAFKFVASENSTYRAVGIRVKKDGSITNVADYLQPKIYTNNDSIPGTLISYAWENIPYGYVTTGYKRYTTQVGQSPSLAKDSAYWLVIIASNLPTGGNIYLQCSDIGTNQIATSSNGTAWTTVDNYSGNMIFYYQDEPGIEVRTRHYPAIMSYSWDEYAYYGFSNGDAAARFTGNLEQGSVSETTYGQGALNTSVYGPGTHSTSTNSYGSLSTSTNNYSIYIPNASASYGSIWNYSCPTSTDLQRSILITRVNGGGASAAGMGASIDWMFENSAGTETVLHTRIGSITQRTTAGSERGSIRFYTKHDSNSPSLKMEIDSTGDAIMYKGNLTLGYLNYAADAGSSDSYSIAFKVSPANYVAGMYICFKANTANTGAASIDVNGLGPKTIVKRVNTTLANNDIGAGQFCILIYDGTNFVLMNPVVN